MQSSLKRVVFLAVLSIGICVAPTFGQQYEINPYAGGLSMSSFNSGLNFKNPAIFGVRGGAFVTDHLMLEGNAGWLNQLNFVGYNYRTSGILYEGAASYHFHHVTKYGVAPFVTFGAGGLTAKVGNGGNINNNSSVVYVYPLAKPVNQGPIPNTLGVLTVRDNDTFFTFSYGGGLKGERIWGPFGLRADFRGRTLPSFYGQTINSFEATGGMLVSWGER